MREEGTNRVRLVLLGNDILMSMHYYISFITLSLLVSLEKSQLVANGAISTLSERPSRRGRGNLQLAETIISLVQNGSDVKNRLVCVQSAVRLNVASHTVDNVNHRLALIGVISVVILDGSSIDGTVATKREKALVPMNVTSKVSIHTILEHQCLECIANIALVGSGLTAVHGSVAIDEDPRSLAAVNLGEILGQPLILLISLVVFPIVAVDTTEGTAVGDEGLSLSGKSLVTFDVTDKWPLRTVCKVCLGVDADEVGKTVIERVPEVADATALDSGHAESVLEGGKVSTKTRQYYQIGHDVMTYL